MQGGTKYLRPSLFVLSFNETGMRIFRYLVLFVMLLWGINGFAMPAYPKKIPVIVDGDTVLIRLYGDEHMKFAEDELGYTIVQKDNLWYYAQRNSDGNIEATAYKLTARQNQETLDFLKRSSKHIRPVSNVNGNAGSSSVSFDVTRKSPVVGQRRILVIMMQYRDLKFKKSFTDFHNLFNAENYSEDGAEGSVRDYYNDVSYGQLQLTCDVVGPFTTQREMSYYGGNDARGNDKNTTALFMEAIEAAADHVSLRDYDLNGDGYVDNVHIIFAGHGEEAGASSYAVWSHEATFYQPYSIQGVLIDRYSCAPELRGNYGNGISRIGPHCHEIGHALGAMDYYDSNYSTNGEYEGTGMWDVMASGSWNNDGITPADFNPYVKAYDFGWINPKPLPSGDVSIMPSSVDGSSYYELSSEDSRDFYLIENRSSDRWGGGLPGKGLLIFHVDPQLKNAGNNINSKAPQLCYVVCASSRSQIPGSSASTYGEINSSGCPYPGSSNNHDFGSLSTPKSFYWSSEKCDVELNNIELYSNGVVHLTNNTEGGDGGEIKNVFFEGFEDPDIQVIVKAGEWIVVENEENIYKFPEWASAYEGIKSMQLSARGQDASSSGSLSFGAGCVDGGDMKLALFYTSLYSSMSNPNQIKIKYRLKGEDEWQMTEVRSYLNNSWEGITVYIPQNDGVEIEIEGIAQLGTVLAIDNIEVNQKYNKETGIINVYSSEFMKQSNYLESPIYDLMGRRLSKKPANGYYIQNGRKYLAK